MLKQLKNSQKIGTQSLRGVQAAWKATSANPGVEEKYAVMPPCDYVPSEYKGPSYNKILKIRRENLINRMLTFYKQPLLLHKGHKQFLFDEKGTRYLDLFAGVVTVSVGHCHPKVNAALHEQTSSLWHTTNGYLHPKIYEYTEKLLEKMPGRLKCVYLTNSGSEANDLAIMMARMYTGNMDIMSFRNGYHGNSPSLMGLMALNIWKYKVPTLGMQQTMNPDVYRGIWGGANCRDSPSQTQRTCNCGPGECHAGDMYLEQLKDAIKHSVSKNSLAALFAESIQGAGGSVQFPKGFLKKAFEVVRENGGLCLSDEVQSGFGRTGTHFWGFEGHDVIPDIVSMAKGIGNGFPMGAVVTTPEVAETMQSALHINTFGGSPMASAVGMAVLEVIEEEKLQENAHVVGTYFIQELSKLRDEFEVVGDVRGKGLMIGMELVEDKESKKPIAPEKMAAIWEATKDYGILVGKGGLYGSVFRIKPPLCITKDDVDFAVSVFRKAIKENAY